MTHQPTILIRCSGYMMNNFGDLSMLIIALERIHTLLPDSRIIIFTGVPDKLKGYFPYIETENIETVQDWYASWIPRLTNLRAVGSQFKQLEFLLKHRYPHLMYRIYALWLGLRRHQARRAHIERFARLLSQVDIFVATGQGGLIDEFISTDILVLHLIKTMTYQRKQSFLFGQGLGPLTSPELMYYAIRSLPKADFIALREKRHGFRLLRSFGVDERKIHITGDDALELGYRMRSEQQGDALGLNIRMASYSEVDSHLARRLEDVLKTFIQQHSCAILPIPISISHERISDLEAVNQITEPIIGSSAQSDSIYERPEDVIRQVGRCRVVITGSYHGAVFALSQGIPVVGLAKSDYYIHKFLGLVDLFGAGCEVVLLEGDSYPERLLWAIEYLWEQADALRPHLLEQTERQIERGQHAYQQAFRVYFTKV